MAKLIRSLLAAALFFSAISHAHTYEGVVVKVKDGDTITVLDAAKQQHDVRLSGIDAPEKAQPYGQRSKQSLSELASRKFVRIETTKKDRYGRDIGKVLLGEQDLNLEQVRRGFAWVYRQYFHELSVDDRNRYDAVERDARETRRGLWSNANPIPPWQFRRAK